MDAKQQIIDTQKYSIEQSTSPHTKRGLKYNAQKTPLHLKNMMPTQEINSVTKVTEDAFSALLEFKKFSQSQVDQVFKSVAIATYNASEILAKLAVEDTGFGNYEDKIIKNRFSSQNIYDAYKDWNTIGIVKKNLKDGIIEISEPAGVVAALIPSTNPTSTTIYKSLLAIKSGCALVCSPHPRAKNCTLETIKIIRQALKDANAPENLVSAIEEPSIRSTNELIKNHQVSLILATGGMSMVKAAYGSGKPAYGVGPGNVPVYIEKSANFEKAAFNIIKSKTFDNGTICSSEQSIVIESSIKSEVVNALLSAGSYFVNENEKSLLQRLMINKSGGLNPSIVGQSAHWIASRAGFAVPPATTVLIVQLLGVGDDYPLSKEKLSPVLGFYVENDHKSCIQQCFKIVSYGGLGHTVAIHSQNTDAIFQFAQSKPAFRVIVNSPTAHGAIGLTTNLSPALTLGPGTDGGSITSDNITPKHLCNIKRIAFDTSTNLPDGMFT